MKSRLYASLLAFLVVFSGGAFAQVPPSLAWAVGSSLFLHGSALFYNWNFGEKHDSASAVVQPSDGGSPVVLQVALSNDYVPPSTSPVSGTETYFATTAVSGFFATATGSSAPMSSSQSQSAIDTYNGGNAATKTFMVAPNTAAVLYRVDEEFSCEGNTKPGATASCNGGGNDNCSCNWRDLSANPGKFVQDLETWRSQGRPGMQQNTYMVGDTVYHRYWGATTWHYVPDWDCSAHPGSHYNYSVGKCMMPVQEDGVCPGVWNVTGNQNDFNPFDPDCARMLSKLKNQPATNTDPSLVLVEDSGGNLVYIRRAANTGKNQPNESAPKAIAAGVTVPGPSRDTTKEASVTPKDGSTTGVSQGQTEKPTPGTTPGTSGTPSGASIPKVDAGGTGSNCGATGQPACKVTIDNGTGSGPVGAIPGSIPISGALDSLKDKTLPVSAVCPREFFSFDIPFPDYMGGSYHLTDNGVFCNVMDQWAGAFRGVSIAFGWISAMFIVLSA